MADAAGSPEEPVPTTSAPDRLLAAATELIVEDGWGAVSTRRVAERAGVQPGLVHYHFDSIEHLRRRAALGTLREAIDAAIGPMQDMTPRQIIAATADMATTLGPGDRLTVLLFESLPPAVRDPDLQRDLAGLLTWFRDLLATRIRAHHPRPTVDPDVIAGLIAATFDGLGIHLLALPDLDIHAHLAPLLELLGPEDPDRIHR